MLSSGLQAEDQDALGEAARQAVDELAHASNSLRDLINDLRPAALDQLGIKPALEAFIRRVRSHSDVEVGLHIDLGFAEGRNNSRLAPEYENGIYRVAQEAVNNAIKHARATRIEVSVVEGGGSVELSVSDDGTGFDTGAGHVGFGLTGMRERVAQLGGRFSISSGERGTTVEAVLPAVHAERSDAPITPAAPG
jgi:signal transduction histidine kinase